MEDYKILIYIVLSILYFLFKGRGKKKKPVTRKNTQSPQTDQSSGEKRKPKSFEELLAELSGESQEREKNIQYEEDDEILTDKKEIKSLSDQVDERPMHQEVSQEDYENADETLKELYKKGERLKSIDELVDIDEVAMQSNRFKEFEDEKEDNQFAREIREGLSDPESAKKAIVYAEILNRKY